MGMHRKTIAGALMAAGMFVVGGGTVVAQQNQTQPRDTNTSTQTTPRDSSTSNQQTTTTTTTTQDADKSMTQDASKSMTKAKDKMSQTGSDAANMAKPAALSSSDKKFITEAAKGGMLEVEMGRLASQKGSSDAVKQFGERLVQDHTKANEELKTLAGSKGVALPAGMDSKHQAKIAKMSGLSGAAFDREFIKEMQKDHKKDVAMFQKQADKGTDADVKAFAAKTLPTLQEHAQAVDQMQPNATGTQTSNPSGTTNPSSTSNPSSTTSPSSTTNPSSTNNPSGTSNPSNTTSPSGTTNQPSSGTSNPSGSGTTRPNP